MEIFFLWLSVKRVSFHSPVFFNICLNISITKIFQGGNFVLNYDSDSRNSGLVTRQMDRIEEGED